MTNAAFLVAFSQVSMQDKLNEYNASTKSGAECTTVAHESIENIKSLVNGLKYSNNLIWTFLETMLRICMREC